MQRKNQTNNGHLTKKIAMGTTGLAITAGVVAAGVVLLNKRSRDQVGKSAQSAVKSIKNMAQTISEQDPKQFRALAHQVAISKGKLKKTINQKIRKSGSMSGKA